MSLVQINVKVNELSFTIDNGVAIIEFDSSLLKLDAAMFRKLKEADDKRIIRKVAKAIFDKFLASKPKGGAYDFTNMTRIALNHKALSKADSDYTWDNISGLCELSIINDVGGYFRLDKSISWNANIREALRELVGASPHFSDRGAGRDNYLYCDC